MVLTAPRLLAAVFTLMILVAGAYTLGRATRVRAPAPAAHATSTGPRALAAPQALRVPLLEPVGALPDLRSG